MTGFVLPEETYDTVHTFNTIMAKIYLMIYTCAHSNVTNSFQFMIVDNES